MFLGRDIKQSTVTLVSAKLISWEFGSKKQEKNGMNRMVIN